MPRLDPRVDAFQREGCKDGMHKEEREYDRKKARKKCRIIIQKVD
jgi:hypothetical protein